MGCRSAAGFYVSTDSGCVVHVIEVSSDGARRLADDLESRCVVWADARLGSGADAEDWPFGKWCAAAAAELRSTGRLVLDASAGVRLDGGDSFVRWLADEVEEFAVEASEWRQHEWAAELCVLRGRLMMVAAAVGDPVYLAG